MNPFLNADQALQKRILDAAIQETTKSRGVFPYPPAHEQVVIGRDEFVIVERHNDGDVALLERPEDRRRELMIDIMDVGYIRMKIIQQHRELAGGVKIEQDFPRQRKSLCE